MAIIALIASAVIWLFPSNVLKLIAEHDHVLLGRYSVNHFSALFFATLTLWILAIIWWRIGHWTRRHTFKLIALTFSLALTIAIIDFAGRKIRSARYREANETTKQPNQPAAPVDGTIRSRPPNTRHTMTYIDQPEAARSYPDPPKGFEPFEVTLSIDANGFRNPKALESCDILAVGDSFTEGSRVSDDEMWPARYANLIKKSVYNIGISGCSPRIYLNNFNAIAPKLKPKIAIFMLYEGNDFRSREDDRGDDSFSDKVNIFIKSSPITIGIKSAFAKTFGPINAEADVPGIDTLSWMPIKLTGPEGTHYLSFKPKRMMALYHDKDEFAQSDIWQNTSQVLIEIIKSCREKKITPVFVYTPCNARVVLPLIAHKVADDKLHAFASLKTKNLPPPDEFKKLLLARIDTQENAVAELCKKQSTQFISLTKPLRIQLKRGIQVYYTYDQHFTPLGHELVADALLLNLKTP